MENTNIITKTTLLAMLQIFTFSLLKAQDTNLSGSWKRNTEKCYAIGVDVTWIALDIQIKQTPATFEITRAFKNSDQTTITYTEVLKFDGSNSQPVVVRPNSNKRSTIRWSADHKALIEESEYVDDHGNHVQKNTEIITLTDGGKTLQIKSLPDKDGVVAKAIGIFDRKD